MVFLLTGDSVKRDKSRRPARPRPTRGPLPLRPQFLPLHRGRLLPNGRRARTASRPAGEHWPRHHASLRPSLPHPLPRDARASPRPNPSLRIRRPLRGLRVGWGRGRPALPGAVLPPGPGLRRRRGHVLVRLPRGRVRGGPHGEARVLRRRSAARLGAGAAARPHRLALRAWRGRAPWLPLMRAPGRIPGFPPPCVDRLDSFSRFGLLLCVVEGRSS
jgi:hypothetical protein